MIADAGALLLELFLIVCVGALVAGVHRLFQRRFRHDVLARHNEVAGFLFSAVAVIYAVLLGFLVIVVWEKFDAAQSNVEQEVSAIADLYRTTQGFPEPLKSRVRGELRGYMTAMQRYEWPAMEKGRQSMEGLTVANALAYDLNTFNPRNAKEQDAHQLALSQEQRLWDSRRVRNHQIGPSVPVVLWFALIVGGIALVGFAFFFGAENGGFQLVMTGVLAAVLALFIVVIAEFDQPFSGAVGVDMDGWATLQEHLSHVR